MSDIILIAFAIIYWVFAFSYCNNTAIMNTIKDGKNFYQFSKTSKILCVLVMIVLSPIIAPVTLGVALSYKLNKDLE